MIKAIYKIENEWNKGEFFNHVQEFNSIGDIENFLAYNRSYIVKLTFEGSLEKEEN